MTFWQRASARTPPAAAQPAAASPPAAAATWRRSAMPQSKHAGIRERADAAGRLRYQVRVNRRGMSQQSTLPTLEAALAWRAQAIAAADDKGTAPSAPVRAATQPYAAARGETIEEASRRL